MLDYIYQYKDHLGNVRLSYSDTDGNGSVTQSEIREENNYYPFGLKHKGYNNNQGAARNHEYGFQEQEEENGLGLNWLSYKYRNHDPSIGRFFNIDPLTEDYMDWGPYVFSGNRLIDARELEGLEPFSVHATQNAAATNFAEHYNGPSIVGNVEIATKIYSTTDASGNTTFSYGDPIELGPSGGSISNAYIPNGSTYTALAHTHAQYDSRYRNDEFSGTPGSSTDGGDIGVAERFSVDGYVATPEGSLQYYDNISNSISTLSTEITSDPGHPNRLNRLDPVVPVETQPVILAPIEIETIDIQIN